MEYVNEVHFEKLMKEKYVWADRNEDCNLRAMVIEWALPIHVLAILSMILPATTGQRSKIKSDYQHLKILLHWI